MHSTHSMSCATGNLTFPELKFPQLQDDDDDDDCNSSNNNTDT